MPNGEEKSRDGGRKRRGLADGLDGCSAVFDGGCCLLEAATVLALVILPLLMLR